MRAVYILALMCLPMLLTACSEPVTERDKALFVSAGDLRGSGCDTGTAAPQVSYKKHDIPYISKTIEYNFKAVADGIPCPVVINITVTINRDASTARESFGGVQTGLRVGMKLADVQLKDIGEFYHFGDQSASGYLLKNDKISGMYYVTRSGRVVYQYLMFGLYFKNAEAFGAFIRPRLERAAAYDQT